jgi:hypothetical protein
MATERLPMRKIREILRQKWVLGYVFTCPAALGQRDCQEFGVCGRPVSIREFVPRSGLRIGAGRSTRPDLLPSRP